MVRETQSKISISRVAYKMQTNFCFLTNTKFIAEGNTHNVKRFLIRCNNWFLTIISHLYWKILYCINTLKNFRYNAFHQNYSTYITRTRNIWSKIWIQAKILTVFDIIEEISLQDLISINRKTIFFFSHKIQKKTPDKTLFLFILIHFSFFMTKTYVETYNILHNILLSFYAEIY